MQYMANIFIGANVGRGVCLGFAAWCWRLWRRFRNGPIVGKGTGRAERYRFGQRAEQLAVRFLLRRGYSILGQRIDHGFGEMDIVAVDHRISPMEMVIVEVKALRQVGTISPESRVGALKLSRLRQAARDYLWRHRLRELRYRIDVIAIEWPVGVLLPCVRHLRDRDGSRHER